MNLFSLFVRETEISHWVRVDPQVDRNQRLKTYPRLPRHKLSKPQMPSEFSLVQALIGRSSAQRFLPTEFAESDLSCVLASVGFRSKQGDPSRGRRTYPSAGARYPAEVYVIALHCDEIPAGLYHYAPREHELEELWRIDLSNSLVAATNDVRLKDASVVLVLSLVVGRIAEKYGNRGLRYGLIEVGHIAQNVSLIACALGKGCYEIGGFIDSEINKWLDIDGESEAAALLVVLGGSDRPGKKRSLE